MSQTPITGNGTICSFNLSPKGTYEGFILQLDKERVQVNLPHEMSSKVGRLASEGSLIELQARREEKKKHAVHPVFRLAPGLQVQGSGTIKVAPARHRVIEAEEVNGIRIEKKHKPEKKPGRK